MVTRLAGALVRALMAGALVALPPLMLGGAGGATQIAALFAMLAVAFVGSEYLAAAPSVVEFRDAPPYNRIRFAALAAAVATMAAILGGAEATILRLLAALGGRLGEALDLPASPVTLLMGLIAAGEDAEGAAALRACAAVAYAASLAMVGVFAILIRLGGWPGREVFNVWVNLPQFDPFAGGDVVERLHRDAAVNLSLGISLPFLVPAAIGLVAPPAARLAGGDPVTLIWVVALWAFLPANLVMRGIALGRVASLIAAQRARAAEQGALQAA
jgi:hypothetical protein